jgi:hypothetical protein
VLINDDAITSETTSHTAQRVEGWWTLSWLPGRLLERNQAITGMTIAELVAKAPAGRAFSSRQRALLDALAGELGLDGADAIIQAGAGPGAVTQSHSIFAGLRTGRPSSKARRSNGLRSESGLET